MRGSLLLPLAVVAAAVAAAAAPASAFAQQVTIFSDDFQSTSGLDTSKWPSVTASYSGSSSGSGYRAGTYDGGPDGYTSAFTSYALYFRSSTTTRQAVTSTMDLSGHTSVTLTFSFVAAGQKVSSSLPFDSIDSNSEEVLLQYTTNANAANPTWVTTPLWRSDFKTNYNWTTISITLPTSVLGTTVAFRWTQSNDESGIDNWALDDVSIVAAPEPGTWALFGAGAAGLAVVAGRRRRRRPAAASPRAH